MRIGYARTSTARQELASQLEALRKAQCHKIFHEQISTRVKVRPELEKALALARQFKEAAPQVPVVFTVHELKRLARNAAELMTLSGELQTGGIQLELLTGIYDPNGMGSMFFAVLAVAGQIERNYIRDKTLEGQLIAASKGNHGGRPKVIDDDALTFALALKDKGDPVPDIAKKLTIKSGKRAGKHPSVASLYRAFAEAEQAATAEHPALRPTPAHTRPHPPPRGVADTRGSRPSRTTPSPSPPASTRPITAPVGDLNATIPDQGLRHIRCFFSDCYFCRQLHRMRTRDDMHIRRFEGGITSLYQRDSAALAPMRIDGRRPRSGLSDATACGFRHHLHTMRLSRI
ncbi:recombinase family protein [Nocardia australiensis]|uniref:recombinase family protein n=1 Tax=Nocardia australiensis TaxID=2887191 RepID=UPI001D136699|nr:recombinase family protein [Nocardia australiensis]